VRTPHELKWRLEDHASFLTEVMTKGKLLYEKDDAGMHTQGRGRLPGHP
jgi:hypothetical protein